MPKILWVALPLLLAAAVLALQFLRGRAPSRTAINIGSSVLLLAYVATTAGLGIFWVANQQLPVFDWHYLFGYGTVLLVSLHLAFNFPLVWRFFARRADRGREASPTARGGCRGRDPAQPARRARRARGDRRGVRARPAPWPQRAEGRAVSRSARASSIAGVTPAPAGDGSAARRRLRSSSASMPSRRTPAPAS